MSCRLRSTSACTPRKSCARLARAMRRSNAPSMLWRAMPYLPSAPLAGEQAGTWPVVYQGLVCLVLLLFALVGPLVCVLHLQAGPSQTEPLRVSSTIWQLFLCDHTLEAGPPQSDAESPAPGPARHIIPRPVSDAAPLLLLVVLLPQVCVMPVWMAQSRMRPQTNDAPPTPPPRQEPSLSRL